MRLRIAGRPLGKDDFVALMTVVVTLAFIGFLYALAEWKYFTEYSLQKAAGLNPDATGCVGAWNWISITVMIMIGAMAILLIGMYIRSGMGERAIAYIIGFTTSIVIFAIIYTFTLSQFPIDTIEWANWKYETAITFLPGYYVPGPIIIMIGIVVTGMAWGAVQAYTRKRIH